MVTRRPRAWQQYECVRAVTELHCLLRQHILLASTAAAAATLQSCREQPGQVEHQSSVIKRCVFVAGRIVLIEASTKAKKLLKLKASSRLDCCKLYLYEIAMFWGYKLFL